MLTDDENIIDIQFAVQYNLKSAEDYVFNEPQAGPDRRVRRRNRDPRSRRQGKMDFALYEGREQIAKQTEKLMQQMLDRYRDGRLRAEGHAAERAAARQGAGGVRRRGEGGPGPRAAEERGPGVRQRRRPARARQWRRACIEEANGYKTEVVQRAEGDASRFKQILVEYQKAPGVTRDRLYLDMMQSVLGNSSKVLVDQKAGSSSLLYLPLDKLMQQSTRAGAAPPAPTSAARQSTPPRAGADR